MFEACARCAQPDSCTNNGRCFGESARGVAASGLPSGSLTGGVQVLKPHQLPKTVEPTWEKGVAGEQRPGGGYMPYLNGDGAKMGVKEYSEKKHTVRDIRKRQVTSDPST